MVKWIGKLSLLLKRLRDAWMDMRLVSAMSRERRESQNLANVTKKMLKDEEMMTPWTVINKRPGTIGTPHR